jgi:hypothetical protein
LKEGKRNNDDIEIEPFGANINNILKQNFFLEKGFIGEFAKNKINELLDFIDNKDETKKDYIQKCIDIIGEPFIREQLQILLKEKFDIKDGRDKEIEELKKEIEQLKAK